LCCRIAFALALCASGCGGNEAGDHLELSLVVFQDSRFEEPAVTYALRSDSMGISQNGEMQVFVPDGVIIGLQPPEWRLTTELPNADDYEIALSASPVDQFQCTGTADFSVPPNRLQIFIDCRADPTGPPAGIELGPALLYIDGDLQVE